VSAAGGKEVHENYKYVQALAGVCQVYRKNKNNRELKIITNLYKINVTKLQHKIVNGERFFYLKIKAKMKTCDNIFSVIIFSSAFLV
jgi:hypothetical protein